MRIFLEVEYATGEKVNVAASAVDLMKFEEKFELSIIRLEKEVKLTHLMFLAWASLYRQKLVKTEFEEWAATVSTIGLSDNDPK